jgi:hypothetical protein
MSELIGRVAGSMRLGRRDDPADGPA